MPKARKSQISLLDTPYYHCVSRCVRRTFLCGEQDGKSFEHRRQWGEDRIHTLSEVFAIDVCAYAVMSNHTHVVLHVAMDKAEAFSTEDVIQRWHTLYKGTLLTQRYLSPELRKDLHETQIKTVGKQQQSGASGCLISVGLCVLSMSMTFPPKIPP